MSIFGQNKSTEPHKCAMEGCLCMAAAGEKYCSVRCEDSKGMTKLQCDCGHPECDQQKL